MVESNLMTYITKLPLATHPIPLFALCESLEVLPEFPSKASYLLIIVASLTENGLGVNVLLWRVTLWK